MANCRNCNREYVSCGVEREPTWCECEGITAPVTAPNRFLLRLAMAVVFVVVLVLLLVHDARQW